MSQKKQPFDVILKFDEIVIMTVFFNQEGERKEIENYVTLTRAKEILCMLETAISQVDDEVLA